MGDSALPRFTEEPPELKRAVHGHLGFIIAYLACHPDLCCRDKADSFPSFFESAGDECRRGRLSLRTSHTDDIHLLRWVS
jgi:hypothetical protein